MKQRNWMLATTTLASILAVASAAPAEASSYLRPDGIVWSSIASVGQVDPASASLAIALRTKMTMKSSGRLVIRYNLPPTAELADTSGVLHLIASFFDPGDGANVDISLQETEVALPGVAVPWAWSATPRTRTVLRLTSAAEEAGMLATRCVADTADEQLDFEHHVYYIVAVLTWNAAVQPRPPFLQALQISVHPSRLCSSLTPIGLSPPE